MHPALGELAQKDIAYDKIPLYVNDLRDYMNKALSSEWGEIRGLEIVSVAIASIRPNEESAKKIEQFQESRVYSDPTMLGARVGSAQATAMENAASNEAGAMAGFVGMGFAQQAGGANAAELMNMGNQQAQAAAPAAPEAPAAPAAAAAVAGAWICPACGKPSTGNFCPECGAKKPEAGWTCPQCGKQGLTGNFCTECGAKKPE